MPSATSNMWRIGSGPAVRLVPDEENRVRHCSYAWRRSSGQSAFLREKHLLEVDAAGQVTIDLTTAAYELTRAGVRQRYPDASPREHYLRMAIITLGASLARRVYPEIEALDISR